MLLYDTLHVTLPLSVYPQIQHFLAHLLRCGYADPRWLQLLLQQPAFGRGTCCGKLSAQLQGAKTMAIIEAKPMDRRSRLFGLICVVATAAAIALVVYGMWRHDVLPMHGAYLIVLLALLALSFTLFLDAIFRGGRIAVESNWGGLGGGLGGWRISSPLAFLLLSIGLFTLLTAAVSASGPGTTTILMERYGAAINFAKQNGIKFDKDEVVSGKLVLKGTAPSQNIADAFWNQLTLANPLHNDVVAEIAVKSPTGVPSGTPGH